jgi:hypothetical protein
MIAKKGGRTMGSMLIAFGSVIQMCIVFILIHDNNKLREKIKNLEKKC